VSGAGQVVEKTTDLRGAAGSGDSLPDERAKRPRRIPGDIERDRTQSDGKAQEVDRVATDIEMKNPAGLCLRQDEPAAGHLARRRRHEARPCRGWYCEARGSLAEVHR